MRKALCGILLLASHVAIADTFSIDINDARQLAGIAAARATYNAANPTAPIANDQDYFSFIAAEWFKSYALQNVASVIDDAVKEARKGDTKKLEDVAADLKANPVDPKLVPVDVPAEPTPP